MRRLVAAWLLASVGVAQAGANVAPQPAAAGPVALGAGLARDSNNAIALAQPVITSVIRAPTGSTQTTDTSGRMTDLGLANRRGNISWMTATPGADLTIPSGIQLALFTATSPTTQATQRIVLPSNPIDGDQFIAGADANVTISALTVADATGPTVVPTMPLYPSSQVVFLFNGAAGAWKQRIKVGGFWDPVGAAAAEQARALAAEIAEAQARDAADQAEAAVRAVGITAEMNARQAADTAEATTRASAITSEASARAAGDTAEATRAQAAEASAQTATATEATAARAAEAALQASIAALSLGCKMQAPQTVSLSVPAVALPAIGLLASTDLTVTGAQLGDQAIAAFTTAPPANLTLSGVQVVAAGKVRVTTAATAILAIGATTLPLKIQLCH